jgi:hypothetical protein
MGQKGHDSMFIDELTNNSLFRANVRDCLRSQTSTLKYEIKSTPALKKQRMNKILQRIESSANASLDEMERSIRELLQIVCQLAQTCVICTDN